MQTLNNQNNDLTLAENEDGNFSAVPHEMTEYLMQSDLTAREFRIVLFLIRAILGYQLARKIIKTEDIVHYTKIHRPHVNGAIKSLIEKKIIGRRELRGYKGEFEYWFCDDFLGRIHATKKVSEHYFYEDKVIHNSKEALPNQLHRRYQLGNASVTKSMTPKESKNPPKTAPINETQTFENSYKDIKKKEKDILRGEIPETFSQMKPEKSGEDFRDSYEKSDRGRNPAVERVKQFLVDSTPGTY